MLKSNNAHIELVWVNLRGLLVTDLPTLTGKISGLIVIRMTPCFAPLRPGIFALESNFANGKHTQP